MFDVVPSRPLLLVLTCPLAGRSWASRCRGSPASHLSTGLEHTVSVTRLFRGKESFLAIARCMKELSLTSWRPFPCNLYNVSLSVEVSRFSVYAGIACDHQQRSKYLTNKSKLIKVSLPMKRSILEDFIIILKASIAVSGLVMTLSSHHVKLLSLF